MQFLAGELRRYWPGAEPVPVTGRGPGLLDLCCEVLSGPDGLEPGEGKDGAMALDLRWGADAPTLGCDLVQWLRTSARFQPVVVKSAYLRDDGSLDEPAASLLPRELGWQPWDLSTLRAGWPSPLTAGKAQAAASAAKRMARIRRRALLDRLWAEARPAAYGQPVEWVELNDLAGLLGAPGAALQAVFDAIRMGDVLALRKALNDYEPRLEDQ